MHDPWDLGPGDARWEEMRAAFQAIVSEANQKFVGYSPRRLLLVDVALSYVDVELHAFDLRGREAPMLEWLLEPSLDRSNIDEIYLEPGVAVWRTPPGEDVGKVRRRALTAHRYIDAPRGSYVRLWPPRPRWV